MKAILACQCECAEPVKRAYRNEKLKRKKNDFGGTHKSKGLCRPIKANNKRAQAARLAATAAVRPQQTEESDEQVQ